MGDIISRWWKGSDDDDEEEEEEEGEEEEGEKTATEQDPAEADTSPEPHLLPGPLADTVQGTVYVQIFAGCIFRECPFSNNFCDFNFAKP